MQSNAPVMVSVSQNETQNITDLRLEKNCHNPFNPTTTIEFHLPENSQSQLRIFNILGQKVRTLIDEKMESGYHKVE